MLATSNYPSPFEPNRGTFVETLARQWARCGAEVLVVAPFPYWNRSVRRVVLRHPATNDVDGRLTVLRPSFVSASNITLAQRLSTARITARNFRRAVRRALAKEARCADIAYGHFLFPAGEATIEVARRRSIPAVAALGESSFGAYERHFGRARMRAVLQAMDGIVAVSKVNRSFCVDEFGVPGERVLVAPNASDLERFFRRDRERSREKLGLPLDRIIVAFVGHFIEQKGPLRVLEAMKAVPTVAGVFLGAGPQQPLGQQVLFAGRVSHEEVPAWLGAADFFVLPTLEEGSCNAVVEAMACGLPVVTSNLPEMHETTDERSALFVDPRSLQNISDAIGRLASDASLRERMGHAALDRARAYSIQDRATGILDWLASLARDKSR